MFTAPHPSSSHQYFHPFAQPAIRFQPMLGASCQAKCRNISKIWLTYFINSVLRHSSKESRIGLVSFFRHKIGSYVRKYVELFISGLDFHVNLMNLSWINTGSCIEDQQLRSSVSSVSISSNDEDKPWRSEIWQKLHERNMLEKASGDGDNTYETPLQNVLVSNVIISFLR